MPDQDTNSESTQECEELSKRARQKARKMDCGQLLEKINELADKEKVGGGGTKGLKQRFRDYLGDDPTHGPEIEKQKRSLRTYIDEYVSRKPPCGDPPSEAYELSKRELPVPAPTQSDDRAKDSAKYAAEAGAGLGLAYITYRVIRMLPSLLPPLWETIPVNLAIP